MRRFAHREPAAAFAYARDGWTPPLKRLVRQPKKQIDLNAEGNGRQFEPVSAAGWVSAVWGVSGVVCCDWAIG